MPHHVTTAQINLGFLSIIQEPAGHSGGYLVTNSWGRPLEFRLSNPVQPSRVQQVLYGSSLLPYLCGELIGKTLIDKTTPVQVVFTDSQPTLALRQFVDVPVAFVGVVPAGASGIIAVTERVSCDGRFDGDRASLKGILDRVGSLDLSEPFTRVREALIEARKLGVGTRAA